MQLHQKSKKSLGKLFILITLVLIQLMVFRVLADEVNLLKQPKDPAFNDELQQLETSGQLSQNLINKIPTLTGDQKGQLIDKIASLKDKQKFWDQWNKDTIKNKNDLLKSITNQQRETFFKEYGKQYGISFNGFGEHFDKNMGFGNGGVVGNEKFYFDSDAIKKFNSQNPENKIVEVEYKKNGDNSEFILKKQDGSSATVISGKESNGYFFNAENNKFYRLKDSGGNMIPDDKNPLSGQWNGKGGLTIDVSGKNPKFTLDFADKNGKPDTNNFAKFTTANGDNYSPFSRPTEKKDDSGKNIDVINKAEITFNVDGKPSMLSNTFLDSEKYKGYFGKDVDMFYNKGDYEKLSADERNKLGSYLIIDEANKYIKGDLERTPGGLIPGTQEYAKAMESYLAGKIKSLDNTLNQLNMKGNAESVNNFFGNLGINTGIEKTSDAITRQTIADKLGLQPDNFLVGALASKAGVETIRASIAFAQSNLAIAEDVVSLASTGLGTAASSTDAPLLKAMLPTDGAYMSLQLKNDFAKSIDNVQLGSGTLYVQDSKGNMVNVVSVATSYGYKLNADFNRNNPYFEGINFNLVSANQPDQKIQIYSDSNNGDLVAKGNGLKNMINVGSQTFTGVGEAIIGRSNKNGEIKSQGILSASLSASSENLQNAKSYLDSASKEYADLYKKYEAEGFTSANVKDLNDKADAITMQYYQKLTAGDVGFSIKALSPDSADKFANRVSSEVTSKLDVFATGSVNPNSNVNPNDPAMQKLVGASISKAISDYSLQDQLAQRGLTTSSAVEGALKRQIGDISQFLRSNSGDSVEFVFDSKSNLGQLKYGTNTMNIDPALAPIVKDVLPIIVGSGSLKDDGSFAIDNSVWSNNRFSGQKEATFYASQYHGLRGLILPSRRAQGEAEIKAAIAGKIQPQVEAYIGELVKNPGYVQTQ